MISVPASSCPRRTAAVVGPGIRLCAALLAGLVAIAALASVASAADDGPRATAKAAATAVEAPRRPRIGLVLSGGGARGIAHIGVLKVLERERIPIDVIAGTSMGAIIGGLYASGMGADEMERELVRIDWAQTLTISSRVDRKELSQRRKEEDFDLSPLIDFGYRDGEFRAPTGAVSSRELELLLRRFTLPARQAKTFDELPIPFRAVATDLETGQQVVLGDGDLALAMRSSMSIPGVFSPTEVNGRILGDGMLVNNVPIDVARAMGADVLIVVNIGSPLASRESLDSAFGVAGQMINILTEQNVQRSLATLKPGDVLIAPDLGKLTSADFDKARELVSLGAAGSESAVPRLAALALPTLDYAAWRESRYARLGPPVVLDRVAFQGTEYSNPARFQSELESKADQLFDRGKAERDARRLAATEDYVRTDYRIVSDGERDGLVFDLEEKSWGPNFLRVGLTLDTDFRGDSSFNLAVGHTRRWLTPNGSEWRNLVQIGEKTILSTEIYHPLNVNLGLRSDWFASAYANLLRREVSLYNNTNDAGLELARFDNKSYAAGFDIGRPWRNLGELRIGVQWLRYRTDPQDIGAELIENFQPQDFIERGLRLRLIVDQLDYAYFTTSGYRVLGEFAFGTRDGAGVDQAQFGRASVEAYGATTWGQQTFDALLLMQGTNPDGLSVVGRYTLGGFQRLSGYKKDQLNGNVASLLRLGWRTPVTGSVAFARALTVGATLEAGNTWRDLDSASWSDLRTGGSLYIGSDTGLGPVYLGVTYAPRGEFGLAFVVGRP